MNPLEIRVICNNDTNIEDALIELWVTLQSIPSVRTLMLGAGCVLLLYIQNAMHQNS
jgi:hypothetical protein